jgi:hypothetical protein
MATNDKVTSRFSDMKFSAFDVASVKSLELQKIREAMTPDQAYKLLIQSIDEQIRNLEAAPNFRLAVDMPMYW